MKSAWELAAEQERQQLDAEFKRAQLEQWSKASKAKDAVSPKERNSMLAIILAFAVLSEIDISRPHAKNGAGEIIAAKINAMLGENTITPRTVADHLAAAKALLHK